MEADDFQSKIEQVVGRFKMWSAALEMLAQPEMASQLIQVLEGNDLNGFESLLEPTRVFQEGGCIDIYVTITHIANFGRGHWEERCEAICFSGNLSTGETSGRVYSLPDGTYIYVSNRQWAELCERAHRDSLWLEQNKVLLKALGMISCPQVWVPDDTLIIIDRNRTICFPTVTQPFDQNE